MANQPSRIHTINVPNAGVSGTVQVSYETNGSNSSIGRVTSISVNGSQIDPTSSQATTILGNSNTVSAFRTSLSQTNPAYSRQVGSSVTPRYVDNASQLYQRQIVSNSTAGSVQSTSTQNSSPQSQSPTQSKVEISSPLSSTTVLAYPKDILTEIQDYIQISAFEYESPNASSLGIGGKDSGIGVFSKGLTSQFGTITQNDLRERARNGKGTVILPMPAGVTDVNGVNWGESTLNPLDAAKIGVLSDVAGAATGQGGGVGGSVDQLMSAAGVVNTDARSYFAASAGLKAIQSDVDVNQLLARTTGYITNPNGELLFTGPRLRGFNFSFRLIPRSKEEAREIRKIVRFFKQTMSAKKSTFLLRTPCLYFIEYKRRSGNGVVKALNKFKPCALTQFNVDNGAGNIWNSYYDDEEDVSQPLITTIQMSFQETTPIFNDDYAEFSSTDDVGY